MFVFQAIAGIPQTRDYVATTSFNSLPPVQQSALKEAVQLTGKFITTDKLLGFTVSTLNLQGFLADPKNMGPR